MGEWTPDGQRIAYASHGDMYWRAADASSMPELLLSRAHPIYPSSWSEDGRFLIFQDDDPVNGFDIWMLPLGETPKPLIRTKDSEQNGRLSRDGRWLAYRSNESGTAQVMFARFPM
jgi:eukaryotic-like serine/threonine-protein kinase